MSEDNRDLYSIVRRNLVGRADAVLLFPRVRGLAAQFSNAAVRRLRAFSENMAGDRQWPRAMRALALARAAGRGDADALTRLSAYVDTLVTADGRWLAPLDAPPQALDGYNVLALHRIAPAPRLSAALQTMAGYFVRECSRSNGCLPYSSGGGLLLVDTLGMLCPFLAAYGRDFSDRGATELAKAQILHFIRNNLDGVSHLPFHGYYGGGPYRLGAHGWGRGVGWYMIGLADTLIELDPAETGYAEIHGALLAAGQALRATQRPEGSWGWVIVLPDTKPDTSVASFCGYALARAKSANLVSDEFDPLIEHALFALELVTDSRGTVGGSSGECRGLTDYSENFGPRPWVQGAAAAFVIEWENSTRRNR